MEKRYKVKNKKGFDEKKIIELYSKKIKKTIKIAHEHFDKNLKSKVAIDWIEAVFENIEEDIYEEIYNNSDKYKKDEEWFIEDKYGPHIDGPYKSRKKAKEIANKYNYEEFKENN
jgi:hypothetical protein